MTPLAIVRNNIEWFLNSGIMRPSDGFWGVGERIVLCGGNEALQKIRETFRCQTQLAPSIIALEHRRADCNLQTALMFELASRALDDPSLMDVADNLVEFLVKRSGLRHTKKGDETRDLWGWSMPLSSEACWTDDNSWVVALLLVLARRGRSELREAGIAAARRMRGHVSAFYEHLAKYGKEARLEEEVMIGMNLSPHWLGLTTMAFAHAAASDPETDYSTVVARYYDYVRSGPPDHLRANRQTTFSGLPWTLSEYGYLALAASIAAKQFGLASASEVARAAADALVGNQCEDGHFPAEYDEAPTAPHLADLVYTQNWATLGLYHSWLLFGRNPRYREAFDRSLAFLAGIQDQSEEVHMKGCWRGLYDTKSGRFGGGDTWEGGQGSIYSGWTNAPLSLAFLCDLLGESLFATGDVGTG